MTQHSNLPQGQVADLSFGPQWTQEPSRQSGWVKVVAARCEFGARVEAAGQMLARGELSESATQFKALLQDGLAAHDTELAEVACHNLAAVYRQSRQWDVAETWQQQSFSWRMRQTEKSNQQSSDELGRLACDLTGRGSDAFLCGDWELADSLWRRALAIEEWRGCWEGQATDSGNLGLLAAARGQLDNGIRWLQVSLKLHRQMLDDCGIGTDLLNLAELRRLQGKHPRAIRLLKRAVRHFHRARAAPLRDLAETRLRETQRIASLATLDPRVN